MTNEIEIEYVEKLHPLFTKPKRLKIAVGSRGSTKSTAFADYVAARMAGGELWCCAREQLNSIEESVHRTILDEIDRLGLEGFNETKTEIKHESGGRCFYRGLSKNVTGLKSTLTGVDGLWIEEGEDLSDNTLRILTASVRLSAEDTARRAAGEDVKFPEIFVSMNRGSINDPVSKKWLARAEESLQSCGYYEDDYMMVVEVNWDDVPEEWFKNSGLEQERLDDLEHLTDEEYYAKWGSGYTDNVQNALILGKWFDACIDAHKKAGFEPMGAKIAAHDPSDTGADSKGYAERHGSVITCVEEKTDGDINQGCDWATDLAISHGVDAFTWDCDGMGVGLNRQVGQAFNQKKVSISMFKGSESPDNPEATYQPTRDSVVFNQQKIKDVCRNKRAQYYLELRDRIYKTYRKVVFDEHADIEDMISFDSNISNLPKLRAELCRLPVKDNRNGLFELYTKPEMKSKFQLSSPNLADSLMMLMRPVKPIQTAVRIPQPRKVYSRR